jgi:phosphoribosyl 1,2-cyclic phosphate phosphodiesterase
MRITMLGCGGSQGVPTAAGDWGLCDPVDPRNRRRRVSLLIEAGEGDALRRLLIDTTPDFRDQMIDAGIRHLDAVLYTHAHADHLHGIDDLRAFNRAMGRPIPIWASEATLADIHRRFGYAIGTPPGSFYRPTLIPHLFDGPFEAAGFGIIPFDQDHGFSRSTGFRIGDFAYSTDVVTLSDMDFELLAGVSVWIVDCVRIEPHPTHSHLERTLEWIAKVKPERAVLTHMDITLDYASLAKRLPPGVIPGHDGLVIDL